MIRLCHILQELELNGLEAAKELKTNPATQQNTQQNSEKPNQVATIAKSQVTSGISAVNSNKK